MQRTDALTLLFGEVGDVPGVDFDGSLDWGIIDKRLSLGGAYLFLFKLDLVILRLVKVCLAIDFLLLLFLEVLAFSRSILEGLAILYACHYTSYQLRTSLCWRSFLQRWHEQSLGNGLKTSFSDSMVAVKTQNSLLCLQLCIIFYSRVLFGCHSNQKPSVQNRNQSLRRSE